MMEDAPSSSQIRSMSSEVEVEVDHERSQVGGSMAEKLASGALIGDTLFGASFSLIVITWVLVKVRVLGGFGVQFVGQGAGFRVPGCI